MKPVRHRQDAAHAAREAALAPIEARLEAIETAIEREGVLNPTPENFARDPEWRAAVEELRETEARTWAALERATLEDLAEQREAREQARAAKRSTGQ